MTVLIFSALILLPAADPDDERLERFGSCGDHRDCFGQICHAVRQLVRTAFVSAEERYGEAAAFIEHDNAGIARFVFR